MNFVMNTVISDAACTSKIEFEGGHHNHATSISSGVWAWIIRSDLSWPNLLEIDLVISLPDLLESNSSSGRHNTS